MSQGVWVGLVTSLVLIQLLYWAMLIGVIRAGRDRRHTISPDPTAPCDDAPGVTIIVPARNEENSVGATVRSALAQRTGALERLVVIDDGSTDATAAEVRRAADGDERLTLIEGDGPAEGWLGKPFACWRGAAATGSEILLFVDADVLLGPDAVAACVAKLQADDLDMLSVWGTWTLSSFWERVAQPVAGGFVRGAHPLDRINDPDDDAVFANGQFIMITRGAYRRCGGHEAVKAEVLEDVRFAAVARAAGLSTGMFLGPEIFSVRLYDSLTSLWRGSVKNFYHGMNRRPSVAVAALTFLAVTVLWPWTALVIGVTLGDPTLVTLGVMIVVQLHALRLWQDWRADLAFRYGLTHELGVLVLMTIIVASAWRGVTGRSTLWKGRPV